jgi:hypothetical protein
LKLKFTLAHGQRSPAQARVDVGMPNLHQAQPSEPQAVVQVALQIWLALKVDRFADCLTERAAEAQLVRQLWSKP